MRGYLIHMTRDGREPFVEIAWSSDKDRAIQLALELNPGARVFGIRDCTEEVGQP